MTKTILVYLLLLPVMWLLTEMVWGGVHGLIGGLQIANSLQDPQTSKEITEFMKKHGLSDTMSKEQGTAWLDKLSSKDKAEFEKLIMKSIDTKKLAGFGSTFSVSIIVFGIVGLLSGLFTKTWYYAGLLPLISFMINNPFVRFSVIQDMPLSEKIIIALLAQFGACYLFAYAGTVISGKLAQRKENKLMGNEAI